MKKKWLLIIATFVLLEADAQQPTGSICVSGNCINGKGRLKIPSQNNREFEGFFKDGQLKGESKVYYASGRLAYTGTLRNFLPDGEGIRYEPKNDTEDYVTEEGEYENDYLVKGTTYLASGKIIASGEFVAGTRYVLQKGFRSLSYRLKNAYRFCDDIKVTPAGTILNGKVTIREGNPKNGLILSEAIYADNKREGLTKEYDHENGVYHMVLYKNGEPSEGGRIYTIAGDDLVATDVNYAPDVAEYIVSSITYLVLHMNNKETQMYVKETAGTSYKKFRELQEGKSSLAIATAITPSNLKYGPLNANDHLKDAVATGKISGTELRSVNQQCDALLDYVEKKAAEGAAIISNTIKKTYDSDDKRLSAMRSELLNLIDNFLNANKPNLVANLLNILQQHRNDIYKGMHLPAYAILKN